MTGKPRFTAATGLLLLIGLIAALGPRPQSLLLPLLRQPVQPDEHLLPDGSALRVHRLNLLASNAYLLELPGGLILVDAGMPGLARLILDRMQRLGRDDLRLIYLTHAHPDHVGSAAELQRLTGAPVAIHRADAIQLAVGISQLGSIRGRTQLSRLALPLIEPLLAVPPVQPDILLEDGQRLDSFGLPGFILHTPGHTPGSSTLLLDGGIAFAGDLLTSTGKPHPQQSFAQDWPQIAVSLAALQAAQPTLIYTGHGADPVPGELMAELRAQFDAFLGRIRNP